MEKQYKCGVMQRVPGGGPICSAGFPRTMEGVHALLDHWGQFHAGHPSCLLHTKACRDCMASNGGEIKNVVELMWEDAYGDSTGCFPTSIGEVTSWRINQEIGPAGRIPPTGMFLSDEWELAMKMGLFKWGTVLSHIAKVSGLGGDYVATDALRIYVRTAMGVIDAPSVMAGSKTKKVKRGVLDLHPRCTTT